MKKFVFAASLLFAAQGYAGQTLVELRHFTGFAAPKYVVLTVLDSGNVDMSLNNFANNDGPKDSPLISLTPTVLAGFQTNVAQIPSDAKMTDTDAGKPPCEDAPTTTVTVTKVDGTQVQIYSQAACHTAKVDGADADQIVQWMKSLLALAPLRQ